MTGNTASIDGMTFDAVIIGAGPAGGTAALALARCGRSVAIIEKSAFPRRKVCGEFMSATNIDLLDALDIGAEWRAQAGPPVRRVALFAGDTSVDAPMPLAVGGGTGRALGRDILDPLLLEAARAAGATIFQPWRAIGITGEGECRTVVIESRTGTMALRAPVVIAAHGSWEHGSLPSLLERRDSSADLFGFKAHFRGGTLPIDLMPLLIFPGGYGGMVWSDHGRLSISCCIRRDVLARIRQDSPGRSAATAVHDHLLSSCRGVAEALEGAEPIEGWLGAGPIRPGIRSRYSDDIFRIGNIAGESHPIIAEGISIAMQSGWMLADRIGRSAADDRRARELVGQDYARAWRSMFAGRIRAAALFSDALVTPWSGRMLIPAIRRFPAILTFGARLSGKTRLLPALKGRARSAAVWETGSDGRRA